MHKFYRLICVLVFFIATQAQAQYALIVEEHSTGVVENQTSYRLYIQMENTDDYLSSVFGNEMFPLLLNSSDGFYNDAGATGGTAGGVNPFFFTLLPTLVADSWATIGIDSAPAESEAEIGVVESGDQPWVACFQYGSDLDGSDVVIDDATGGAWYVLNNGNTNGLPDAENNRVLCAQLTTAGSVSGLVNVQIFQNGQGSSEIYLSFSFNGVGVYTVGDESTVLGCTDESACNYDISATDDDGSCAVLDECGVCGGAGIADGTCDCDGNEPATGYGCNGDCLTDTDGDGTCDEFEVSGCDDAAACNFDLNVTDNDGSCDYCSCGEVASTEGYTLTLETYGTELVDGATTYRLYIDMLNDSDYLSSLYGNSNTPLLISSTTSFYNDPAASGGTASGVNPFFFPLFPTLAADSWATIGIDSQPVGSEVDISVVESGAQPWVACLQSGGALDGSDLVINDETGGAWYVLNGNPNGLPDSENSRVLFAQLTTSGVVSGTVNVQIFEEGDGGMSVYETFSFSGPGVYSADGDGSGGGNSCGCTDESASNYDSSADYDDGSCEFGIFGCTDESACNYDSSATDDDGSCEVLDACGECGGDGIADGACDCDGSVVDDCGECGGDGNS